MPVKGRRITVLVRRKITRHCRNINRNRWKGQLVRCAVLPDDPESFLPMRCGLIPNPTGSGSRKAQRKSINAGLKALISSGRASVLSAAGLARLADASRVRTFRISCPRQHQTILGGRMSSGGLGSMLPAPDAVPVTGFRTGNSTEATEGSLSISMKVNLIGIAQRNLRNRNSQTSGLKPDGELPFFKRDFCLVSSAVPVAGEDCCRKDEDSDQGDSA